MPAAGSGGLGALANKALGMVQLNGRWVTQEESYQAQGYVQFEGKWMTPAEQQSIVAGRQASKKTG